MKDVKVGSTDSQDDVDVLCGPPPAFRGSVRPLQDQSTWSMDLGSHYALALLTAKKRGTALGCMSGRRKGCTEASSAILSNGSAWMLGSGVGQSSGWD